MLDVDVLPVVPSKSSIVHRKSKIMHGIDLTIDL